MTVCRDGSYIKSVYSSSGHLMRFPAPTLVPTVSALQLPGTWPLFLPPWPSVPVYKVHTQTCDLRNDLKSKSSISGHSVALLSQWKGIGIAVICCPCDLR